MGTAATEKWIDQNRGYETSGNILDNCKTHAVYFLQVWIKLNKVSASEKRMWNDL